LLKAHCNASFELRTTTCGKLSITVIFALIALVVLSLSDSAVADDDDELPAALGHQSLLIGLNQVAPVAGIGRGVAGYLVAQ
jgi:hypothetical protein